MIQDKIFFDEKDPTGLSYNTPFTYFGSYQGRLWSKAPGGEIKYYTQNSDLSVYAITGSNQFNGNQAITGSLTVTGGIIGTTATSSYVEYSNVANKPTLVSGSSQVSFSGIINKPTLVSGSSQVSFSGITNKPTLVSSSVQVKEYNVFATTGSNGFNGSQSITGSLTVTGQVIAQTINVQQVTSSIVYSSGSNIFGNNSGNTHQFTGSVGVTGSLTLNGTSAVVGSGTTNYLSKFTGTSTIGNSSIADNGSGRVSVGTSNFYDSFVISNAGTTGWEFANNGSVITYNRSTAAYIPMTFQASSFGFTGSATFSSNLTATGNLNLQGAVTRNINFYDSSNTNINAQIQYDQISSNSGQLFFGTNNAGTFATRLTISNTGAATFSSTITTTGANINGDVLITNASNAQIGFNTTGALNSVGAYQYFNRSGSNKWTAGMGPLDGSDNYQIVTGGVKALELTVTTGKATFTNSTSGNALRLYTSYASGRALNFGFSDGSVLPTAAFYIGNQTGVGVFIGDETTTNGLYVKANGDVGIGFTTVTNKLQVAGEITTHAGTNTQFYAYINYLGTTYNFGPGEATDNVDFKIAGGGTFTTGGNFRFFTQAGGTTPTERMRISSSGNVGIGTGFTPSYPLHVYVGVADWGAVVQNLNASSYGMYVRGGATNGSTSAFYVANTAASQLLDIKGDGRTFFTNTVTAPSFTSLSTSASIPFTTWTTVYNTDTYYGGIYLIQVGLNGASSDDWSASAIYFSGAASDMRYLVGPVNGNLVQLRKTGNSIQVYQNGTSPSVTLSIRVLKVS